MLSLAALPQEVVICRIKLHRSVGRWADSYRVELRQRAAQWAEGQRSHCCVLSWDNAIWIRDKEALSREPAMVTSAKHCVNSAPRFVQQITCCDKEVVVALRIACVYVRECVCVFLHDCLRKVVHSCMQNINLKTKCYISKCCLVKTISE